MELGCEQEVERPRNSPSVPCGSALHVIQGVLSYASGPAGLPSGQLSTFNSLVPVSDQVPHQSSCLHLAQVFPSAGQLFISHLNCLFLNPGPFLFSQAISWLS